MTMTPLRPAARRATRYHVELACDVIGRRHDAPQLMWATDLSAAGIWLESEQLLTVGEPVVVCFRPAVAWRTGELTLFAQVARISSGRRWGDRTAGLGLRFTDLDSHGRHALEHWLRPRRVRGGKQLRKIGRRQGRGRMQHPEHPFAARRC